MSTSVAKVRADALSEGARRIIILIKRASPGVTDRVLFEALAIAAGISCANAEFPEILGQVGIDAAQLFAAGFQLGHEERLHQEKESCKGAA